MEQPSMEGLRLAMACVSVEAATYVAPIPKLSLPASFRGRESAVWRINKLFGREQPGQELTEVSVEPDAAKRGQQKDSQQPRSGSLRDSGGLEHPRIISPRRSDADLDGTSTCAGGYEGMSTHRSSCYSDRRRWQAEEEDPSRE